MQVSKDTPDELAALTKPLEPVAKRVPKKQLKEKRVICVTIRLSYSRGCTIA